MTYVCGFHCINIFTICCMYTLHPIHLPGIPNTNETSLSVHCLDVSFPYAYEYLGCRPYPIFTPRSLNCIVAFTQSLVKYSGCELIGPQSSGKTSFVTGLGMLYGKHVFIMQCNQLTSPAVITSIMEGCSQVMSALFVVYIVYMFLHVVFPYVYIRMSSIYIHTYMQI